MPGDRLQPDPALFEALRPRLFRAAYRMLGLRADAEDVLQDAWLRWQATDVGSVQSAEAWLMTVVTRLAIDRLRIAKREREAYFGDWLPEPIVDVEESTPEHIAERADDVSIAFLHLLERLNPEERAAFLLRQVFDYDYAEVAAVLGKSEAAVRQAVHRATERLRLQRPRFNVPREVHLRLLRRFVAAAQSGDRRAIRALLDDDVTIVGDGGGKVVSVPGGMRGGERISNLYWAHHLRFGARIAHRIVMVNGQPGLLRLVDGLLDSVVEMETDGERIVAIYAVRNPDKLRSVPSALAVTPMGPWPS